MAMQPRAAKERQISKQAPADMLRTFKTWWKADRAHSEKWRRQAREDFKFVSPGGQYDDAERAYLMSEEGGRRQPIEFNRTLTLVRAVAGIEINGRMQITYIPRGTQPGAVQKNELLSQASDWMDDESGAPKHQSRAFQDAIKCGMGWTEASLAYDEHPDGGYVEKRVNPLEMWWDHKAREDNLADARRVWRVRTDIDIDEARAMFPTASDEDLDAAWADTLGADDAQSVAERRKMDGVDAMESDPETITLVQVQWVEHEPYWRANIGGRMADLDGEQKKQAEALATQLGAPFKAVQMRRKVYRQAFVGSVVLSEDFEAPCPHFSFNCVTGESDEMAGTWFGLIAVARDPQKWANKWLMQGMHILNSTAKGGVIAEEDAFADQAQAEKSLAHPSAITWAAPGAISQQKLMPKPGAGMPQGYFEMMNFALGAIRDVTGINLEILGLREATQPGVLEAQRKQAGMTILATLFDSLKSFRQRVGKVRLYFIQEYFADPQGSRMIRISGEDGQEYVPLVKDKVQGRYDVQVDDAPTTPNQREQTWAALQPIIAVFKDQISPEILLDMLEYSPLPSALIEKIKKSAQKAQEEAENNPEAKAAKELQMRGAAADVAVKEATAEEKQASATQKRASARKTSVDAAVSVADAEQRRMQPQQETEKEPVAA